MIRNKAVFISGAVFFFVSVSQASFYEVNGRISWDGKAFGRVSAYLLYDIPQQDKRIPAAKVLNQTVQKRFSEEYAFLEKERSNAVQGTKKRMREGLQDLAKKYRAQRVVVDKKGEFYLNVSPGILYYVFVLKQPAFLEHPKNIEFWLNKLNFNPGEVLNPVEITLDESNVSVW
jgi:hypothetical protein